MSGLVKAKDYDWKDSNLALFGSDTEKKVKKESAESEPAWHGAGEKVGLQIWRIVKFKVEHWDKDQYGSFYSGDSYILLNTYKEPEGDELLHDLHFWIGKHSTQDEYGAAAYKTVELDTFLDDKPVQHREVMNHESSLFKTYFKAITLLKGGAESGFNHVEPEKYKFRLLHVKGTKDPTKKGNKENVTVKEVALSKKTLNDNDVFILDAGLKFYQWNPSKSSWPERFKAAQYLQTMKSKRPKAQAMTIDGDDKTADLNEFRNAIPDECEDDDEEEETTETDSGFTPSLYRLSNASGKLEFQLECEVPELPLPASKLDSMDVFIADTGSECFVWVGNKADEEESRNGMAYAHGYLQKSSHPLVPVSIVKEGKESAAFKAAVSKSL